MPLLNPPSSSSMDSLCSCVQIVTVLSWDVSVLKDYEEDFEETDESMKDSGDERETQKMDEDEEMEEPQMQRRKEIEAIQKAMDIENQRVGTTLTVLDTNRKGEDGQKLSRGTLTFLKQNIHCSYI